MFLYRHLLEKLSEESHACQNSFGPYLDLSLNRFNGKHSIIKNEKRVVQGTLNHGFESYSRRYTGEREFKRGYRRWCA